MAAQNKNFPWMSHYEEYGFFEDRMRGHNKVSSLKNIQGGLYDLSLTNGKILKIFICECYSYGVAEYQETIQKLGQLDAIIINSNWCGYSPEAKIYCRERSVGLFKIREFMAALNLTRYWEYLTEY
ncbi:MULTISPECIES: hypothetical protein [Pseudomonas]|uniref:hypothetical protein n=1 Tax=Pseudomonas TaxID=286 RepID=UPI0006148682|nr:MULTISPECIES: hypothetical protein [Pseudomonas]MDT3230136.1 hypothetical protein [Pseudomonas sp. rhizo25]SFX99184.1 hypothetical protein SAMN03159316_3289 [Pseudomonas sp. NFR02]